MGYFYGASFVDYNNDGYLDVFVCDFMPTSFNHLYINNGGGTFEKDESIIIANDNANCVASCWGDYDGFLELFASNTSNGPNFLYHNNGDGSFSRITTGNIGSDIGNSHGCSWADVDKDGYLDLYVSNNQSKFLYIYFVKIMRLLVLQNTILITITGLILKSQ